MGGGTRIPQFAPATSQENLSERRAEVLESGRWPRIQSLSDDILALFFEAGRGFRRRDTTFGESVSHVSQQWRTVALRTPHLWSDVVYHYAEGSIERLAAILSRSRSVPVDIEMHHVPDYAGEVIQLIGDHMVRCRRLRVVTGSKIDWALTYVLSRPAPLLTSLVVPALPTQRLDTHPFHIGTSLKILDLGNGAWNCKDIPLDVPALATVTHLRMAGFTAEYSTLRSLLMTFQGLSHLELHPFSAEGDDIHQRLPVELPALEYLYIGARSWHWYTDMMFRDFEAPLLHTVSFRMRHTPLVLDHSALRVTMEGAHLTSLRHVILHGDNQELLTEFLPQLMYTCPNVERLTCWTEHLPGEMVQQSLPRRALNEILDALMSGGGEGPCWERLGSIAIDWCPHDDEVHATCRVGLRPSWKLLIDKVDHDYPPHARSLQQLRAFYDVEESPYTGPVLICDRL
ncbi:hypothetical protein FIBSPDRAFT_961532 [Athelia psychrophila]|uniref:F-box domain-containing protein n=1 Tax=Athelia psychrophila TaxID=1759441 RepID=A0A166B2W8_9AGAM|nr:hypothetical protein FIBSPDRAFT_961532 [Fibularhizoctonia sp. CBS 109695]